MTTLPDASVDVSIPDITLPDITLPDVSIPDLSIPDLSDFRFRTPGFSFSDITLPENFSIPANAEEVVRTRSRGSG